MLKGKEFDFCKDKSHPMLPVLNEPVEIAG